VEAGIKSIYIGTLDFNPSVYDEGRATLETGRYIFELDNGSHAGDPKDALASQLLEEYFISKKYAFTDSKNSRVYKIGEPVRVGRFDDDLIEEVCELNASFLRSHRRDSFR
jgi:hypothetical protein